MAITAFGCACDSGLAYFKDIYVPVTDVAGRAHLCLAECHEIPSSISNEGECECIDYHWLCVCVDCRKDLDVNHYVLTVGRTLMSTIMAWTSWRSELWSTWLYARSRTVFEVQSCVLLDLPVWARPASDGPLPRRSAESSTGACYRTLCCFIHIID